MTLKLKSAVMTLMRMTTYVTSTQHAATGIAATLKNVRTVTAPRGNAKYAAATLIRSAAMASANLPAAVRKQAATIQACTG